MMWRKHIFFFFFWAMTVLVVKAQPEIKKDWNAYWIGEANPASPNSFQRYRKTILLDAVPLKALVNIAVDSKYWLWINGEMVVFEGGLKRGPSPRDTYFDEVDLQGYLRKGSNTICIMVWYWGKDGFSHKSSGKSGLLFELWADGMFVGSDSSWKTRRHSSFGQSAPPHPNYRLAEHNIHYNAILDGEDWIQPSFNDNAWPKASKIGEAGGAPWNALWKRPIPLWKDQGLKPYLTNHSGSGDQVMRLPANISVTPYFKIEAPAGLLIDIRTDNYLGGGAANVRTEYVTKEGIQEFESPAYMNGHFVLYSFPPGVKVHALKYRETKFNSQHIGYFYSSSPFLDKLWSMSATTLNINMRDGIFDCPDRERAQWWGDIVISLEEIFYTCDKAGASAVNKAISNLLEWQKDDGSLYSPIPAGNWDKELPAQILAAISKYGIWKYIQHSGDSQMIAYAYPFIRKYLALWQQGDDGLVVHRKGDWDWHDWGDKVDHPLLDNAWYFMALESASLMARHLGLAVEEAMYQKKMQTLKLAFQRSFWKGNRFVSHQYGFYADDRGNGLAVCAGLADKDQWSLLKPVLDTTFHAGPYLEKYVLEAYFKMNDTEAGIRRLNARYREMVGHPWITTLWEGWEIGSATYGGGTYNHGWTGGPLSLLSGYVAGIRCEDLGFSRYSIKPSLGYLEKVDAGMYTPKGNLNVEVRKLGKRLQMQVVTINAEGLIAVPRVGHSKRFSVNGLKHHKQFIFTHQDETYFYFQCKTEGKWQIDVW
jgi:alpha-L-rhamnosidase